MTMDQQWSMIQLGLKFTFKAKSVDAVDNKTIKTGLVGAKWVVDNGTLMEP